MSLAARNRVQPGLETTRRARLTLLPLTLLPPYPLEQISRDVHAFFDHDDWREYALQNATFGELRR